MDAAVLTEQAIRDKVSTCSKAELQDSHRILVDYLSWLPRKISSYEREIRDRKEEGLPRDLDTEGLLKDFQADLASCKAHFKVINKMLCGEHRLS